MFVRNGEVLGSVLHSTAPEAARPQPEPLPDSSPSPAAPPGAPPGVHDRKQDWVDYAVSRGADPGEAESLTKVDLIELYGSES